MNRRDKLIAAYNYLCNHGRVHKQKDLGAAIGKTESTMSKAFNGKEDALTDKLFRDICTAFPGTFNLEWFLEDKGDMLINHGTDPTGFVAEAPKEQQNDALAFASAQLAQLANKLIDSLADVDRREKQLNELIARLQNQEQQLNDLITRLSGYEQLIKSRVANNPILGTGTSHFFEGHQVSDIEIVSESPVLSETHKNTH